MEGGLQGRDNARPPRGEFEGLGRVVAAAAQPPPQRLMGEVVTLCPPVRNASMMHRSALYRSIVVSMSRVRTPRPTSKVARSKKCHRMIAGVAGGRVPRGRATSAAAGIASDNPCSAIAVVRHRVARGARTATAIRSRSASGASARR